MIPYLKTLFAYDDWSNRESMLSITRVDAPPPRAWEVMAHIVGCQYLWHGRLTGAQQPAEVWPQLTTEECSDQLGELAAMWNDLLRDLTAAGLTERVSYTNSKGEDWASEVQDILFHVVSHGSYHRGQIATLLGRAGHEPAYTDFIHCIRQQLLD